MKNKIVVFDLDDTLYKEIDFVKSAFKEIARWIENRYDKTDIYRFMLASYIQGLNVFASLNETYRLDVPIDLYLKKYREHKPDIRLSEEVENLLAAMLRTGITMGMITDGRSSTQTNKIKALGLYRFICDENCIISESFGHSKPSPEAYLYFQRKYGDKEYYYVGDNVGKDFISPNRLGWSTVCLLDDGRNIHKQFSAEGEMRAKYEIKSFDELKTVIGV